MKFADRLKQTTQVTSTSTVVLDSTPASYRSLAQAIADGDMSVGDTGVYFVVDDGQGNVEGSYYTITNSTTLTRTSVYRSTNNNAAVAFGSGAKNVFNTVPSDYLKGTDIASVPALTSVTDTTRLFAFSDAGELRTITAAVYKAYAGTGTPPADTTAPTLSSPLGTSTGTTTANGTVSTNESNGVLYYLFSTSSSATSSAVKAAANKAVTATGTQTVSTSALTAATQYYVHFVHTDAAGNNSNVSSSAAFTTSSAGDTTAPTLSSPTGVQTGSTSASGTVSTNEANGNLYQYISQNTTETASTVKAANVTTPVIATGVQNVSFSNLNPSTTYYAHYLHRDAAGNDSSVASSGAFTTAAGASVAPVLSKSGAARPTSSSTGAANVTTDTGNGTLYRLVSANSTETADAVKAANVTQSVVAAGNQIINLTGISGSTLYMHVVHRSLAGIDSAVASTPLYQYAPRSGVSPKSTILPSTGTNSDSDKYYTGSAYFNGQYYDITPTPASFVGGWGESASLPPPIITTQQNTAAGGKNNGMIPLAPATAPAWSMSTRFLWQVPAGVRKGPIWYWMQIGDAPVIRLSDSAGAYIEATG